MAYSSSTAILVLFPGLPQASGESGYTNTVAIIDAHITRADSLINGKIANRYDPSSFATKPALLITLSEDICGFYTMRSLYSEDDQNVNEWTEKFQDAITMLDEIRKGDMDLVDASDSLITPNSDAYPVESNTEDFDLTFNEKDPLEWEVDSDKLV